MELTGAARPELLEDNAPVLDDAALVDDGPDEGFYLVGLIGGKDVGKSALVNALVARPITAVTSHGAGTEICIAYAHASRAEPLKKLLERVVPGNYRIVPHDLERLRRQVLLDLPDIDSKYLSHLEVTRTMLRHLLFPVWVSSIEKYADIQPQQMLARVAEGNTPENFVFVLNKVDQLTPGPGGLGATPADEEEERRSVGPTPPGVRPTPRQELRDDFAERIARTLKLPGMPRVYMISARQPARFELPALRDVLSQQKSTQVVRESKHLAAARQDRALLNWLDGQELALRARRLTQLQADAEDVINGKLAAPILERIIPRLLEDTAARTAMTDDVLQDRIVHWPVLNLVHTVVQPLYVLLRSAVSRSVAPMRGAEAMVDAVMQESGESAARLVQSAFAYLRQSQPAVAVLYPQNKLWEDQPADAAALKLRQCLAVAVQRQRSAARRRLTPRPSYAGPTLRWLATVGALLWFPFLQPILAHVLPQFETSSWHNGARLVGLVVDVLGVDYLLRSAGFMILYYVILWLALRWNTQRKVTQLLERWRDPQSLDPAASDPSVNLAIQTRQWLDGLLEPIRAARTRMQSLADRSAELKSQAAAA